MEDLLLFFEAVNYFHFITKIFFLHFERLTDLISFFFKFFLIVIDF